MTKRTGISAEKAGRTDGGQSNYIGVQEHQIRAETRQMEKEVAKCRNPLLNNSRKKQESQTRMLLPKWVPSSEVL